MGYRLGIDLGTTYTSAAVLVAESLPTMVGLENRTMQVPYVFLLQPAGQSLVAESAERRGITSPSRVAREFKRRIGDPAPLLVAGTPFQAQDLQARLLTWAFDRVVERQGSPPD